MIPPSVNWNENFKLRIANSSESFQKHEVVKLLYIMKYIEKHKNEKNWLRIYSEWEVMGGIISDLYIENIKEKSCYAVEFQKNITKEWTEKKVKQFKDWEVYGMNSSDLIIVPIKEAPSEINKLSEWLNQYVF
jgi:hypothetical protein